MGVTDRTLYGATVGTSRRRSSWLASPMRRREALAGYVAILPWFLGFLSLAWVRWSPRSCSCSRSGRCSPRPHGRAWRTIRRMLADPLVASLRNTLFYTVLSVPLNMVAALCAATC